MATIPSPSPLPPPPRSQVAIWLSIVLGVALVCAIAFGVMQFRRAHSDASVTRWQPYIDAAKTFAHDRYTATPDSVDADIDRFIGDTTGELHDELLAGRDMFKKTLGVASWSSTGSVLGAGLEKIAGSDAQVFVAVRIDFVTSVTRPPPPKTMLLRLTVTEVDAGHKVSKSEEVK